MAHRRRPLAVALAFNTAPIRSVAGSHQELLWPDYSAIRLVSPRDGKATAIERAIAFQHDPKAVNTAIQSLQAVTADDVQRVMKKYFNDNNRVVIFYANDGGSK